LEEFWSRRASRSARRRCSVSRRASRAARAAGGTVSHRSAGIGGSAAIRFNLRTTLAPASRPIFRPVNGYGDQTVNELAGQFGVHPTLIHGRKK
jgi:hypothetical protein